MKRNNTKAACLFLPETGFYSFTRALAVMGAALQKEGRDVLLTRCSGQMPHCSLLAGHKVPLAETAKAKKHLCKQCQKNLDAAQKAYNFTLVDLADLHTKYIQEILDGINCMSAAAISNVTLQGCPVSQFAQYDFGLESKGAFCVDETPEWLELFRAHVANTALAGYYAQTIAETFNPSTFLTFNQYSQCNAVRFFSGKYGAKYQSLTNATHFNADCSQFWIYPEGFHFALMKHTLRWPEVRDRAIPAHKAYECWQDVVFRNQGQGSHIYSSGKTGNLGELFTSLGLSPERKLIVAYTSSNDEIVGSQDIAKFWNEELQNRKVFPDQISWLCDLRDWAELHDDIQVVVRIHPREGKGKNYNHASAHLGRLREAFPGNGHNFFIVWPEDPVSSYDLLELAHACVIPWTSMGLEASRVGVPVLSWVGNMHYLDDDFVQVATEYEDYRKRLNKFITFEYSWQTLTRAVRYYHWRTFVTSLDIRETVPIDFADDTIWPMPPQGMERDIVAILDKDCSLLEYNREKWLLGLPQDAMEQEKEANKKGFRLYVDSLFHSRHKLEEVTKPSFLLRAVRKILRIASLPIPEFMKHQPPKPFAPPSLEDYDLKVTDEFSRLDEYIKRTKMEHGLRVLVIENDWFVWHVDNGEAVRRMSPLLIRLARCM